MMMRKNYMMVLAGLVLSTFLVGWLVWKKPMQNKLVENEPIENEEAEMSAAEGRAQFEFDLLKDPRTGRIPDGIRAREIDWAKGMPNRNAANRTDAQNTYIAAGPTQNGGRTRALAFDLNYNGTSNRIMIAGSLSGGIFRTTDGGANWINVHPENELHNVSCIAQDPRPGSRNIWYAGGGEYTGGSAGIPNTTLYLGYGILKSIDNGLTWAPLASTQAGTISAFDNTFDLCFRIAVNPTNGDVFVAGHGRVSRSQDGGATWSTAFGTSTSFNTTSNKGMTDVVISNIGKVYVAMNGRSADATQIGVWESTNNGNAGSFTNIGGNVAGNPSGWRAPQSWGRIGLALAPSDNTILYALYENALSSGPLADLFKYDAISGSWSANRQGNLFGLRNGSSVDNINLQGGYDMEVKVHPTNPDIVFIGGTNIYRSTDGFSTSSNNYYMAGYGSNTFSDPSQISHPDQHTFAFDPSNPNRMAVGNDGGLQITANCTASPVVWSNLNGGYQTFQYYYVALDPTPGVMAFAGGAQDNGSYYRDVLNILGNNLPDPNDHLGPIIGGDGVSIGLSAPTGASNTRFMYAGFQYGPLYRCKMNAPLTTTYIPPPGLGLGSSPTAGLFVTLFHLDQDNTENLYYARNDSIFYTPNASTVTSGSWLLMPNVAPVATTIRALATSRGTYNSNSHLYFGTTGRVFKIQDPINTGGTALPIDITPPTLSSGGVVYDIAVNPRNQDSVVVIASNYGIPSIFLTGNATSASPTWTDIEGNLTLPSVRSCEFAVSPSGKTEIYVGTSVGLFSTDNPNGSSTVWFNEGTGALKTTVVMSMAYRPSDKTLLIGTHGNGMFYTQISNSPTAVNVITNDKSFINSAFPTIVENAINYRKGSLTGINKVNVQVTSMTGAVVYNNTTAYQNGSINLSALKPGTYVLQIMSDNQRYRFVQKIVKQ